MLVCDSEIYRHWSGKYNLVIPFGESETIKNVSIVWFNNFPYGIFPCNENENFSFHVVSFPY